MELAQMYFPAIAPRSAWRRMKDLLRESSTTAELAEQSRRVFMPAEVASLHNKNRITMQDAVFGTAFAY